VQPGRDPLGRDPLLVEHLAADALGEALQRGRALAKRAHDALADRDIIVDYVALGEAPLRKAHLVGAGDPDGAPGDVQFQRIRHAPNLTPGAPPLADVSPLRQRAGPPAPGDRRGAPAPGEAAGGRAGPAPRGPP